jgi:ABC-type nickel/cobalt efflux system permease component RcnA
MTVDLGLLILTAASIGCIHTLLGPDHYVPFVAMGAARRWTMRKTLWVTSLCGLGHVAGSVAIGVVGIGLGLSLERLEWFEGLRGEWAAWLLTGLGLAYLAWGLKQAMRSRPHSHGHYHADGTFHRHEHGHRGPHLHPHVQFTPLANHPANRLAPVPAPARAAATITPWALFVVFILGPCEPLIPVLMYPAAQLSVSGTVAVVLAFGVATIATMLAAVYLGVRGIERLPLAAAQRYAHALAGAALSVCGLGILFLGL